MGAFLLTLIAIAWLVAAWAMIRMVFAGLKAGVGLWGLINPSTVLANYNRANFKLFVACVAAAVAAAIAYIALFVMGHITP